MTVNSSPHAFGDEHKSMCLTNPKTLSDSSCDASDSSLTSPDSRNKLLKFSITSVSLVSMSFTIRSSFVSLSFSSTSFLISKLNIIHKSFSSYITLNLRSILKDLFRHKIYYLKAIE
jgi:hypothetical protein